MKVTVKNFDAVDEKPFPKMMKSKSGNLVWFSEPGIGVVVCANGLSRVPGELREDWDMSRFTDFHGKVTLEND